MNSKTFPCKVCGRHYKSKRGMFNHISVVHKRVRHSCELCGKILTTKQVLQDHMSRHTGERPYKCTSCDKCYVSKGALKVHLRSHQDKTTWDYQCIFCETKCLHMGNLTEHIRGHTQEKLFTCGTCGKGFWRNGSLLVHERTHSTEIRYSCPQCKFMSANKYYFHKHLKRHQRLKCMDCDMTVTGRNSLRTHMWKFHKSGDSRYVCPFCERQFREGEHLYRHILGHIYEKPVSCELCGREFNSTGVKYRHIRREHTKEKAEKCGICNKGFDIKSELKAHVIGHKNLQN